VRKPSTAWAYPVTDWKIILRYKQNNREWEEIFYNIPHLKNYFIDCPEKGVLVGYGHHIPQHRLRQSFLPVSDCKLLLWYIQDGKEYFYEMPNAKALVHYLNNHPAIAHAVSYVTINSTVA
jgi:hypothetical protein